MTGLVTSSPASDTVIYAAGIASLLNSPEAFHYVQVIQRIQESKRVATAHSWSNWTEERPTPGDTFL